MSLSGTLGSFALPDVLRLLATTQKTGCLSVETERGRGTLELFDGNLSRCVSPWSGQDDEPAIVLFEMLCAEDGTFSFDNPDITAEFQGARVDIEEVLATAESYLAEWQEILKVVPSTASRIRLEAERDGQSVTLSAEEWRAVVALGAGDTVLELGAHLQLGELATGRLVRDLLNLGVVAIADDAPIEEPPSPVFEIELPPIADIEIPEPEAPVVAETVLPEVETPEESIEPTWSLESWDADPPESPNFRAFDDESAPSFGGSLDNGEADGRSGLFGRDSFGDFDSTHLEDISLDSNPFASEAGAAGLVISDSESESQEAFADPTELTRQLANLSPRAAAAVAAVAGSGNSSESEAVLAELSEDGDDSVNRGLLLKFLSNIKE